MDVAAGFLEVLAADALQKQRVLQGWGRDGGRARGLQAESARQPHQLLLGVGGLCLGGGLKTGTARQVCYEVVLIELSSPNPWIIQS